MAVFNVARYNLSFMTGKSIASNKIKQKKVNIDEGTIESLMNFISLNLLAKYFTLTQLRTQRNEQNQYSKKL